MGVAAWNRGSEAVARFIRNSHDPHAHMSAFDRSLAILLDDLNKSPAGSVNLFEDTVARYDENHETWWLMNKPDKGWGEFGIPMSLREIRKTYNVRFGHFGRDEHSLAVVVYRGA